MILINLYMKKFFIRHIDLFALIVLIILYRFELTGICSSNVISALIWILVAIVLFRALRKIIYKVRNRIMLIFFFIGLVPVFFILVFFYIMGRSFLSQAIGLDLGRTLMAEKAGLRSISSEINCLIIKNNGYNSIDSYLYKKGLKDLVLIILKNGQAKYHYGDVNIPLIHHEDHFFQTFIFLNDRPYIYTSINQDDVLYDYGIISALPLESGYQYDLLAEIGGHIYYDKLPLDKKLVDENNDIKLASSSIAAGRFGFGFVPNDHQRKRLYDWHTDNVEKGNYIYGSFISACLGFNEGLEAEEALLLALTLVPVNKAFHKFLEGTYGPYIPDNAVSTAVFGFLSFIIILQLTSIIIGMVFTVSITKTIGHFHKNSLQISKGKFPPPINSKRRDQLGDLTRAFDTMSLEIQALLKKVKEKERLDNEIMIAQMVQKTFFPKEAPELKGLKVYGGCTPATMVSGDFYDFHIQNENTLDFCIGDISGKGISASLLMAASLTFLRLESVKSPMVGIDDIIHNFNEYLCRYSTKNQFCSLIYGRIDTQSLSLELVNAGHPSPVVLRNGLVHHINSGNIACGISNKQNFAKTIYQLKPGDMLFVFTDGFTDTTRDRQYCNMQEHIYEIIKKNRNKGLMTIYNILTDTVKEINEGRPHMDDMTSILISLDNFNTDN